MLPTNLRVVGATEDRLLEVTAIELGATELRGIELGATELLGTELGATLDLADDAVPPAHTVPLMVGRSAAAPFLLP